MKKLIFTIALLIFAAVSAEQISGTNSATVYAPAGGPYWVVSVVNTGTNTIFFRKNVTAGALVASNAIPIKPEGFYTSPDSRAGKGPFTQADFAGFVTTNGNISADVAFDK